MKIIRTIRSKTAIFLAVIAAVLASLFGVAIQPGITLASMTNCQRSASGFRLQQICSYSAYPNASFTKQAVYVKCDGMWPISDYYVTGNWATHGQISEGVCDPYRTPRYVSTFQA